MPINILITMMAVMIAYLFGSLSSAIIVCKLLRLPDPRTKGSHNPGATNVLRIGGKVAGLITLLGDMLKGFIPVLISSWLQLSELTIALVALAAFLGHLFPIFFRFQGGKGVATLIGCLFALSLPIALCWIGAWLVLTLIFRYVSLASMISAALTPIYLWLFTKNLIFTLVFSLIAIILIGRHHSNIAKLISGREDKLGSK